MSDEKKDSWEMPKPVFKSSEGSLPKSFEETISQSFIANAETLEIDEDDDILGIMDTLPGNVPIQSVDLDDEPILETDPPSTIELVPEEVDISADEPTTNIAEQPEPIHVTAKEPSQKTMASAANSRSNSFAFVMVAVIVAIAALIYYFVSQNK